MPRQRPGTRYACGEAALIEAATHPDVDIVVIASAGHAALKPAYEAILAGKAIALANKEIIVCAGQIIMPLVRERGISLRPVDSEHSAIWQSLGSAKTLGDCPPRPDRIRGAVSLDSARRARVDDRRRCAEASHLVDGRQDHDRFRHDGEQGTGADRSALALRCRAKRASKP